MIAETERKWLTRAAAVSASPGIDLVMTVGVAGAARRTTRTEDQTFGRKENIIKGCFLLCFVHFSFLVFSFLFSSFMGRHSAAPQDNRGIDYSGRLGRWWCRTKMEHPRPAGPRGGRGWKTLRTLAARGPPTSALGKVRSPRRKKGQAGSDRSHGHPDPERTPAGGPDGSCPASSDPLSPGATPFRPIPSLSPSQVVFQAASPNIFGGQPRPETRRFKATDRISAESTPPPPLPATRNAVRRKNFCLRHRGPKESLK